MNEQLISRYGRLWARNEKNFEPLRSPERLRGVYILCDGSTPVYIGKGILVDRISVHHGNQKKKQYWDHFSFFAVPKENRMFIADLEALIIRMLPFYLRSLNKQRPSFVSKQARMKKPKTCDVVDPPREFPRFAPKPKKHKKQ
jgi:hypothetical protein